MERVAPRQVMYENQLPLAIESKSQRRKFYPEGASTYGPQGNANGHSSTIRIPINADSLLDVQHSYLQFKITNNTGNAIGVDMGAPVIRRLRIESAGTTLEDIQEYGRLYGAVLQPSQAGLGAIREANVAGMGMVSASGTTALSAIPAFAAATADGAGGSAAVPNPAGIGDAAAVGTGLRDAADGVLAAVRTALNARTAANTGFTGAHEAHDNNTAGIAANGSRTYNLNLVSGLLNMDKYLPLVMMNAGIVLELELGNANDIGVSGAALDWQLSDVRYIGHLIDLQRDFYDKLRMVMEGSGSVLQLTGTTYRTFSQSHAAGVASSYSVNIPARMKSIKSIFFIFQEQVNDRNHFSVASAIPNGVTEYQFRVGSVMYPPESIKGNATNVGEYYQELRKAFGTLGDYQHGGVLLDKGSYYTATDTDAAGSGEQAVLTPYALDFESFPKTSLENGINSADRSLPITLDVSRAAGIATAVDSHIFVMCDAVFYVNLDGSVSVSI